MMDAASRSSGDFQLRAALAEGIDPDRILVNGIAKHTWLTRHPVEGLRVQSNPSQRSTGLRFSRSRCHWRFGLRCHVTPERDAEDPGPRRTDPNVPDAVRPSAGDAVSESDGDQGAVARGG